MVEYSWQKYVADCLGVMTIRLHRMSGADNYKIPLFSEMIEPEKANTDNRSAEEIKNDILKKLTS